MPADPNLEPEVAENVFSYSTQTEGSILTPAEEDDIPSENVAATLGYFHDHFLVPVEYLNQIYHDKFDLENIFRLSRLQHFGTIQNGDDDPALARGWLWAFNIYGAILCSFFKLRTELGSPRGNSPIRLPH